MKPDFSKMRLLELRAYIQEHRTDEDAIRELFVNRRSPDETATWYSFSRTEEGQKQMEEVFRQKIQELQNERSSSGGTDLS